MVTDLKIGDQLGRLTLVSFDPTANVWQMALFDCACGTKGLSRRLWYWLDGNTRSCGCLRGVSLRKAEGFAQLNYCFGRIKGAAKRRGIVFELTREQFAEIAVKPCVYCGSEPTFQKQRTYASGMALNGVDRIDSAGGYVLGNIAPCCWICNRAKGQLTVDEFKAWLARAAEHLRVCH